MSDVATLFLLLDAPFSAWRWLQAGVYRASSPVIPLSAAWGLALNLAGAEIRGDLQEVVTPIRPDAPVLEIAVGEVRAGSRSTLYKQLYSYPVGDSGKELKARTFGAKYWIAPARREVLVGSIAAVGVRGPVELVERIPKGLAGQLDVPRYGLPFAGDNQLLFNRIDVLTEAPSASWFVPWTTGDQVKRSARLTMRIDRADASRTEAPLFVPSEHGPCPAAAWVSIGPRTKSG